MRATLSLLGMYNYDPTIFDEMLLPESIDRSTFFYNLLMENAELEVLYPEPTILKKAIHFWSKCELKNWEWLIETQNYDYNPIWNVDVRDTEDLAHLETRNLRGTNYETRDLHGTNNETRNLAGTDTGTIGDQEGGSDTTTNQVVAFNTASGFTDKDKSTTNYGKTNANTRNLHSTDTGTDNFTSSNTGTDHFDSSDTGTIDNKRKNEYYKRGNYGTTTTQEMIKQEQELAKINIDDYIRNEFKKRFLIMVY